MQLPADCTPCHTWSCQLPVNPWATARSDISLLQFIVSGISATLNLGATERLGIPRACAKHPTKSNFFTFPTLTSTNLLTHCPTHPAAQ
jgi:hypothetical protein